MSRIVVDANVIVALLYEQDSLHKKASAAMERARVEKRETELLDVLVFEAVSVLGRRAIERKLPPETQARALAEAKSWFDAGGVRTVGDQLAVLSRDIFDAMNRNPRLSANDALKVVLQAAGAIGDVLTFDTYLASVSGFRTFPATD